MPAEKIQLEEIESSNLKALGYNPEKQILAVQFHPRKDDPEGSIGAIFHYSGVALDVATALYGSESRGRFYSQHVKGKYTGRRMTGPCPACNVEGWVGDVCASCGDAHHQEKERVNAGPETSR